ncbi:interferon-related developmental regulator 2 isoform X1 [Rhodamnia argentea]|uniref:Interferon-related developmental regulator 2 isoform X1 n=1 Tax=Rhodamnia argentea TaxID=178133 RepID=A0ABM3H264_9MYRT|nr:interferon-related developmental regulator 2 isoform X1 [Rhodamnia argentea]
MGKRSSQRKHAAMVDSDDDDSSASSSSTTRSDRMSVSGNEEVQLEKDSLLDHALDALYEKRGSTREKALSTIIEAFNSGLQHEFVEKKFATLLHHCIASIKKGSAKEVSLASHAVGLLALTVSCGNNAREILEETFPTLAQALKTGADSSKTSALLECLAIVTFVGGNDPAETERSMQIMWQLVHPKLGSNVAAVKPSPAIITAMVSAWAFLLTSIDGWSLDPKSWQESISYFSGLLDKDDRSVRIAAGEALAVIFDMGSLEKFCSQAKDASDGSTQDGKELAHVHGLRGKVLNQVRNLSVEAGGKGSAKKDLNSQRNLFKDILEFLEYGNSPEASIKIGGDVLQTSTWCKLIQLNFLKHFLGGGFVKHMQDNELLHEIFGFTPKKKYNLGVEHQMSSGEKRLYKSPNSVINKARTQFLNKQRMLSEVTLTLDLGSYLGVPKQLHSLGRCTYR